MPINSNKISYLTGSAETLENMLNVKALPVFSDEAVKFLFALSVELMSDKRIKNMPDVISYAYWIRKAYLSKVIKHYSGYENRIGRGVAFHIAPSNVPVNFAVSFTSCLLAGNACIIRVSNKIFEQVQVICEAINKLFRNDYKNFSQYLCIIRYEHDDEITAELSSMCDIRIIWGGDNTIKNIRLAPLPPRAIEMSFADRYSIAVINAEAYLESDTKEVAKGFYIDTYYTDQNACSSPRAVIWTGKQIAKARDVFWESIKELVLKDYEFKPIQVIDKLSSLCELAVENTGVRLLSADNFVTCVAVDRLSENLMDYKSRSGYFFEYTANDLSEIIPLLGKSCQTIAYLGINPDEIRKIVFVHGVRGVDRIVPVGKTMDLTFTWDGYDMIYTMSRIVYIN